MSYESHLPDKPLVLFDGVCNLCSETVQFVIRQEPDGKLLFSSLQSALGQKLLSQNGLETDSFDTLLFFANGQLYNRSTAALKLLPYFKNRLWLLLYLLIWIPRPVRDFFYKIIARNRYRWFGKKEFCWMPTPELKARFV